MSIESCPNKDENGANSINVATATLAQSLSTTSGIPGDVQDAVVNLIERCEERDIEIPLSIATPLLQALSDSKKKDPGLKLNFSERIASSKAEIKEAISNSPLVIQAQELQKILKLDQPCMSLRVKDGYFKSTKILRNDAEKNGTDQRIEKVFNGIDIRHLLESMKQLLNRGKADESMIREHYPVKNVNLTFERGKTYLVLGAPRSGKSTLLKMIAGILSKDKDHEIGGSVQFNNFDRKSEEVVWSNIVGYIDQIDRIHPFLTVKETFDFAWKCRSGGTHRTPLTGKGSEIDVKIEQLDNEEYRVMVILESLGLMRVKDTFVGDQQTVRGVSGGEKKRVTVGEMGVGSFPISCMDEISTGLDAATTYDICKLLGEMNSLNKSIKIVSLLQPPPETFALFDDLILLSEGKIIYSGPVEEVVPHFELLGYCLPERMDVADWLQALPTKDGVNYLQGNNLGPSELFDTTEKAPLKLVHLTSDEFHCKFYESQKGRKILEELENYTGKDTESKSFELKDTVILREWLGDKFKNSSLQSLKLLVRRECLLWWRDKTGIKTRVAQDLIMGIIAGTLFWQQSDVTTSVIGILFQSLLFVSLGAMMKVAPQYAVRGILYKQQDANFFPTWTYVVGRSIATIPASIIDGLLYGSIIYWFVGLAYNDGASFWNYIMFVLIVLFCSVGLGLMFSIYSAITPDRSTGQAYMSVSVVLLLLFSGFTVQPDVIPGYWIWIYWLNIFAWGFRGLVVNEFDSGKYDFPSPVPNMTEGQLVLSQLGFVDGNGQPYTYSWAVYSVVFAFFLSILSIVVASICLRVVRFSTGKSLANDNIEKNEDENTEIVKVETELPFQKVDLAFRDIHYTVISSIGKEKIELLKGIDGTVEAGKMTALMGSSGAGKTTLMDVLALRKTSGEIAGDVWLNGHHQDELTFRRCTGYVEQFDVQSAALTIRETCEFSAKLRLQSTDPSVTPISMNKFIDQTLDMLELTPIQKFQVGNDATGGLSFEQKKRLSIAVELVSNPSILFLDEPTSGLDARAASIVMRGLKRIALTGRAVCATIHQPSIAIFNSFDTLLLLKRGGEVVYYGDLGDQSKNLIDYLQSYDTTPLIQPGENPATWMLTTIGAGSAGSDNHFDYAGSYCDSSMYKDCLKRIDKIVDSASDDSLISFPSQFATPWTTQIKEVLKRSWKIYWRSPTYNRTRIFVATLLSLLIGSVFVANSVPSTEGDMNSRITTVYLSFLIIAVNGFNTVLAFFEAERNMYYRHKASLMYNTSSISFAFTVAEIPFLIGTCFLYTTIFYFMVGFAANAEKFFLYYLFMLLCMSCFTYLGHMFVSLSPDAQIAQGFGGLLMSNTSLFSGVLIRPENIPTFWKFMYWLLPGHYILEGLLVSQFTGDETPIEANPGSPFWDYLGCITTSNSTCVGTADQWVISNFDGMFSPEHIPGCIGYLVGLLLFTRIVTLWALGNLNYRKT